jgi:hypothetical protein
VIVVVVGDDHDDDVGMIRWSHHWAVSLLVDHDDDDDDDDDDDGVVRWSMGASIGTNQNNYCDRSIDRPSSNNLNDSTRDHTSCF